MTDVKLEMSSLTTLDTCVVQITNVAPAASLEQMSTLFGFLGKIEDIKLYPSEDYPILPQSRVCYVRYAESWSTGVAQHLTNTVFVDRALIVVPVIDGQIPDEAHAMSLTSPPLPGIVSPGPSQLINSVQTVGTTQVFTTVDPNLTVLGLPQYPPLPANIDPSKVEEIRRTVYVGNLDSTTTTEQLLKFFNQVGEVKYVRMAGDETQPTRFAFVEFTDQSSVSKALQYNGIIFGSRPLKVNHSNNAIVKPQAKSSEAAQREIEEAMKRVREAQSLITAAIEPELNLVGSSIISGSAGDSSDSKKKDSRRSRSRSRSRKRSRSRERRKSRSRERRSSRTRRSSLSPRRSNSRGRSSSSRSRRRSPKKRSRSKERKVRKSASPRKSRSRSRDHKKRAKRSGSRTPSRSGKSSKSSSSRAEKSKSSPKREKSPKVEKDSPRKDKSPRSGPSSKETENGDAATGLIDSIKEELATSMSSIPFLEDTLEVPKERTYSRDDSISKVDESKLLVAESIEEKPKVEIDQPPAFETKTDDVTPRTPKQDSPARVRKGASRSGSKHKSPPAPSHRKSRSRSPSKRKSRSPSGKTRRRSRSRSPTRKKRRSSRSPRRRSRSPRRRKGSPSPPVRRRSRSLSHSRSRSRSVRRKHRSPPRRRSRSPRRSPSYTRSRRRTPSPRRRSRTPRRRSRTPRKHSRTRSPPPRKENKHKKKKDRDRSRDRKKSKHRTGTRSPDKDVQTDGSDTKVRRDYDEEEKGYDSSGNEDHHRGGRGGSRGGLSEHGSSPSFDAPSVPASKTKKAESDDSDHRSQQMDLDSD